MIFPKEGFEFPEPEARRRRSWRLLESEGIPTSDATPLLPDADQTQRRETQPVIQRTLCLLMVALRGEGLEEAVVEEMVTRYGVQTEWWSPNESSFISEDGELSESRRAPYAWRYESLWMFLWALGFMEDPGFPDQLCDASAAVGIVHDRGPTEFREEAELRDQEELLDMTDLIMCMHWAAREAKLTGQVVPASLHIEVLEEWHRALNWIIDLDKCGWDQVQTST